MKILLTGEPKSGKTTLLEHLTTSIASKRGMTAQEVLKEGRRFGFDLVDEQNNTAVLARSDKPTDYPVGRFFVDTLSLNNFIDHLFTFSPNELLFIDEIGQMQLTSEKFVALVEAYLSSSNDYVGTISAIFNHPFINRVRSRTDIFICVVTPANRQMLETALTAAMSNRQVFNNLPSAQKEAVFKLGRQYVDKDHYNSLNKLFRNALRYVAERRFIVKEDGLVLVQGNHDTHSVRSYKRSYQCDCDLFNGTGRFSGQSEECSHIQTVKIETCISK